MNADFGAETSRSFCVETIHAIHFILAPAHAITRIRPAVTWLCRGSPRCRYLHSLHQAANHSLGCHRACNLCEHSGHCRPLGCPALHLDSRYLDVSLIQSMLIDLKSLMRRVYPPVRVGETHPRNGQMRCAGQGTAPSENRQPYDQ